MAYNATIIPVMIASPGDVSEEREIIRSVIHDWNDVNAASTKVMLAPIGWETHSSPELSGRPQQLINDRLLTSCDILIGVFWTRLGTPTGKSASGSVEEIKEHIGSGKPAMVYFSNKPVAPESLNPKQYENLLSFKTECAALGLIEPFDTADEFRRKLAKHLPMALNENPYVRSLLERHMSPGSNTPVAPSLSDDATEILMAATKDAERGQIVRREHLSGACIDTGTTSFGQTYGREFTRWTAALYELRDLGLVKLDNEQYQIYSVTHAGYLHADGLK